MLKQHKEALHFIPAPDERENTSKATWPIKNNNRNIGEELCCPPCLPNAKNVTGWNKLNFFSALLLQLGHHFPNFINTTPYLSPNTNTPSLSCEYETSQFLTNLRT